MPHLFKINLQRIKYLNVISGTQELIRKVQGKDFKKDTVKEVLRTAASKKNTNN